jgi:hypothetical protein
MGTSHGRLVQCTAIVQVVRIALQGRLGIAQRQFLEGAGFLQSDTLVGDDAREVSVILDQQAPRGAVIP